jgi:hypothetical protein
MYINEWRISEKTFVPTANDVYYLAWYQVFM